MPKPDETHVWHIDDERTQAVVGRTSPLLVLTTAGHRLVTCIRAGFREAWCVAHDSRYIVGQLECWAQQDRAHE